MDELARQRFVQNANAIASNQTRFELAMRELNSATLTLEAYLGENLDSLERINGQSPDTLRIRAEVEAGKRTFADSVAAIDAVKQHLDLAAVELARLVGAIS